MNQEAQKNVKKLANEIDKHVGKRIKMQRGLTGASQSDIAEALDITFQQIQKYERGTNRVSASRLYVLANYLKVPVGYFFDDFQNDANSEEKSSIYIDLFTKKETLKLMKYFYSIEDKEVRQSLLFFMKSMGKSDLSSSAELD